MTAESGPADATGASSVRAAAAAPAGNTFDRWVDLAHFDLSGRYRNSYGTEDVHNFESGQQRSLISGQLKLDPRGRYAIGFRASSGRYFNWAYTTFEGLNFTDVMGQGYTPQQFAPILNAIQHGAPSIVPQSRGGNFYLRELYLSASPIPALTIEFGGLGIDRGVATEVTTFDDDGYIAGERIRLRDKNHLFFDQISATFAYLGDVNKPNFLSRGDRLAQNNYRQVAVQKAFTNRVAVSGEYDWLIGFNTLREAARVRVPEAKVVDSVRLELYQRLNAASLQGLVFSSGEGWSVAADKDFFKKSAHLEAGYASIDPRYGAYGGNSALALCGFSLNGDSYQIGERVFQRASYTPNRFVTLAGFYTHELNPSRTPDYHAFNRQTVEGGVTFHFNSLLTSKKPN